MSGFSVFRRPQTCLRSSENILSAVLPDSRLSDDRSVPFQQCPIALVILWRKTTEDDFFDSRTLRQGFFQNRQSGLGSQVGGETVHARADTGEGDAADAVFLRQQQRILIRFRQLDCFVAMSAEPNRPDGVNHKFRRQPVALGDFCLACAAAVQLSARFQQLPSRRAVNRAVHAAR